MLAFVTRQKLSAIPSQDGGMKVDTGQGVLHAIILSDRGTLDRLWGPDERRDPSERPVRLD